MAQHGKASNGIGAARPCVRVAHFSYGWGAYERHLAPETHEVGKQHTQKIESKHINLWTRIKRLVRRTMCVSKTTTMYDLVIGLFINRYEFGVAISHEINTFETPSASLTPFPTMQLPLGASLIPSADCTGDIHKKAKQITIRQSDPKLHGGRFVWY